MVGDGWLVGWLHCFLAVSCSPVVFLSAGFFCVFCLFSLALGLTLAPVKAFKR
ncbi:hypothetical protein LZ32DRAFT_611745 [Colletotrichum eremochloae]|nr:hypothetical protein LZ32DRAFT_611745 [Colletotrichum eremochloae]